MYLSLDVETACGVGCEGSCKHAVDFNRNRITVVGLYGERLDGGVFSEVHRDLGELRSRLHSFGPVTLVGFNLIAFDLKTLKAKGLDLTHYPVEDVMLQAVASVKKIPDEWLERYEGRRKEINKSIPHGHKGHREAGQFSLKTLAPYFLGVEPFWEATDNHDNDEYVLKDAKYTYELFRHFSARLEDEKTEKFYRERLIPWAQMLARGEEQGVSLDFAKMALKEAEARKRAELAKAELDARWSQAYLSYLSIQSYALGIHYKEKAQAAIARLKAPSPEKVLRTRARYEALCSKAKIKIEPLNLDSPAQLSWLLKEHLGYDLTNFEGEESTGIEVLERLAAEGKEDVKTFIEYREAQKLCTAFFPSYREYAFRGKIHANFRLSGTRTGRLSSSSPNLQQQPAHVRDIFVSRPGYTFVIRDYSGIEPVVVAYYSQDSVLCDLIIRGGNFHSFNAPAFFPYIDCPEEEVKKKYPKERDLAKTVGLALMYGAGPKRIQHAAMAVGYKWSYQECRERFENFKELYRGVFEFKTRGVDPTLGRGGCISNLVGRKYTLPSDDVMMKGLNTLVQSSASDLVLLSSQKICKAFETQGIPGLPLLWIHDEVVVEVPDEHLSAAIKIVDEAMTGYKLPTPLGNLPLRVEGTEAKYWAK